jgi:putative addiction module component (TIGR02574 family)
MTLDQIVEEARHWPPEKVGELVGRLTEDLHAIDPETEVAWKTEIGRRIEEIENGKVQPISPDEVSARIRKILRECCRSKVRKPPQAKPTLTANPGIQRTAPAARCSRPPPHPLCQDQ